MSVPTGGLDEGFTQRACRSGSSSGYGRSRRSGRGRGRGKQLLLAAAAIREAQGCVQGRFASTAPTAAHLDGLESGRNLGAARVAPVSRPGASAANGRCNVRVSEAKRLVVTCRCLVGPGTVGVGWIIAGAVLRSTGPKRNLAVQVPMGVGVAKVLEVSMGM